MQKVIIFMEVLDWDAVAKDQTGTEMGGGGGMGDEDDAAKPVTPSLVVRIATVAMAYNRILKKNRVILKGMGCKTIGQARMMYLDGYAQ